MQFLSKADKLISDSLENMLIQPQAVIISGISMLTISLMTAWTIYKAYLIIAGFVQEPFNDLIKEYIKKSIILAVAMSSGLITTFFGNPINDLNEGLSSAIVAKEGDVGKTSVYNTIEGHVKQIGFLIDAQWEEFNHETVEVEKVGEDAGVMVKIGFWMTKAWEKTKEFAKQTASAASSLFSFFTAIKETIKLCLVLIGTLFIGIAAFLTITLNKLFLTFCLGFAPLFIFFAAFEPTKGWFNSWLNNTLGYALSYPVIVFGVNALLDIYAQLYSGDSLTFFKATSCLALGYIFSILIGRLGDIASGWFGSGNIADGTLAAGIIGGMKGARIAGKVTGTNQLGQNSSAWLAGKRNKLAGKAASGAIKGVDAVLSAPRKAVQAVKNRKENKIELN